MTTMRERLIKAVTDQRNLEGSVDGFSSVVRLLGTESAEVIVDAILDELRTPDAAMLAAGMQHAATDLATEFTAMITHVLKPD